MSIAIALMFTLAFAFASRAAETSTLEQKAEKAAADLPLGCIVTARQTGDATPVFSIAGKQDPKDVPPENMMFEIGSISKVFTAILLAQAETGALAYKPIWKKFPIAGRVSKAVPASQIHSEASVESSLAPA